MIRVQDVSAQELIPKLVEELKTTENITPPDFASYVKSGVCAERPPQQKDFWYIRSSAILRKIYLNGPIGVEKLRTMFGGKRRRGHKPAHHEKAGGKIIRLILQQLEKEELIKKEKKGRIITPKAQKMLNRLSKEIKGVASA